MNIARRLGGALLAAMAVALLPTVATAADAPVIESVVDRDSGTVLWSMANPAAQPLLKPGQAILLKGRNFGQGGQGSVRRRAGFLRAMNCPRCFSAPCVPSNATCR